MSWRARPRERCNDTERLLRSGRSSGPPAEPRELDHHPVLLPGSAQERADEALQAAAVRLAEAQQLLTPHRDRPDTDGGRAYDAVHAARGGLAAARHWQALEQRVWGRGVPSS